MSDLQDPADPLTPVPSDPPARPPVVSGERGNIQPGESGAAVSGRRLSNRDFELVIRRAAELQAKDGESPGDEGLDQVEALRIGREIGLSTQHLHRALLEITGTPENESGFLVKLFGPAGIHASRSLAGDPAEVAKVLERHLVEREYLAVQRRFPDRTRYVRATGVVAAVGRGWSQVMTRAPLLRVASLEVAVRRIEEGYAYVTLTTHLNPTRTTTALGSIIGGGAASAGVGLPLAIGTIYPLLGIVALPIFAGAVYGGHIYYQNTVEKTQIQMESLLDRLEHGELAINPRTRPVSWGLPK